MARRIAGVGKGKVARDKDRLSTGDSHSLRDVERELEKIASTYTPPHRLWTPEETAMVVKFYLKVPSKVLAEKLDRTESEVRNRFRRMRLPSGS